MRTLTIKLDPAQKAQLRDQAIAQLAIDYALTQEQIHDIAEIVLGNALRFCEQSPHHTLSFVHWEPCPEPGCKCGKLFPHVEASFALPARVPLQGTGEGH